MAYSIVFVKDIVGLSNLLKAFRATHLLREGNISKDFMAGGGLKNLIVKYFMDHMLNELRDILSDERFELNRIRKI